MDKRDEWTLEPKEAVKVLKRVLRLVDGFLSKEKQSLLVTDGRNLMTWEEIRQHVKAAKKIKLLRKGKSEKGKMEDRTINWQQMRDAYNKSHWASEKGDERWFSEMVAALALPAPMADNINLCNTGFNKWRKAVWSYCTLEKGHTGECDCAALALPAEPSKSEAANERLWNPDHRGVSATPCPECKRSDGRHEEGCTWDASATPAPSEYPAHHSLCTIDSGKCSECERIEALLRRSIKGSF